MLRRLLRRLQLADPAPALPPGPGVAAADRLITEGRMAEGKGDFTQACELYRKAVLLAPRYPAAHLNLGVGLEAAGDADAALQSYEAVLAIDPGNAFANYNLGKLHFQRRGFTVAEGYLRAALERKPGLAEARIVLAHVLVARGDPAGAAAAFDIALRGQPGDFGGWYGYGKVLRELGRTVEAEAALERAATLDPANVEPRAVLFELMQSRGNFVGALSHLEVTLRERPDWVEALYNKGCLLLRLERLDEAEAAFKEVIARSPEFLPVYRMLGSLLHRRGRMAESLALYATARARNPDSLEIESFELFALNFVDGIAPEELSERHKVFGERLERSVPQCFRSFIGSRDPDRKLRVGYVSGDFSFHPVSLFLHPLLTRHDRARFDVYCYSVGTTWDDMTRRLSDAAGTWRDVRSMSESQLAEIVHRDAVDILVDLSGHSGISRLGTFARGPAPVQAAWLGYLNTTGLTRIRYRISDFHCDPPGLTDGLHTETLIRLPDSQWCYRPFLEVEPCVVPPHEASGRVTFGAFTQLAKLTPAMRVLWARILAEVPGSHLVIGGLVGERTRQDLLEAFALDGIDCSRVTLRPYMPVRDYYRAFCDVDLALDTFPYSGGTTTFDALWMGVPVLTMAGRRPASRSAASILTNMGLTSWIAASADDYVQRAVRFAIDRTVLAELRQSLRQRMIASPLMQEEPFARSIEAAYRGMWRDWCLHRTP